MNERDTAWPRRNSNNRESKGFCMCPGLEFLNVLQGHTCDVQGHHRQRNANRLYSSVNELAGSCKQVTSTKNLRHFMGICGTSPLVALKMLRSIIGCTFSSNSRSILSALEEDVTALV